MSAFDYINTNNKKSYLEIKKSKIKNAGNGLFTKKYIPKNTNVVIYYGEKIDKHDIYNIYMNNPNKYCELNKYIRGTSNDFVIFGIQNNNMNLNGVFVNDIGSITCSKNELNIDILKAYVKTKDQCNLITIETNDFPVYASRHRIKKGEELYVHYGIGYWLSYIGCSPDEISDLNIKYNFNSLYT